MYYLVDNMVMGRGKEGGVQDRRKLEDKVFFIFMSGLFYLGNTLIIDTPGMQT